MKFNDLEIEIKASDGSISEEEYENKILESFVRLKMIIIK